MMPTELSATRRKPRWRRFRSSIDLGIMWLTLIASPVSGIRHQALVGELVLKVEDGRQAVSRTVQLRVGGDVVDAFVAEPDLTVAVAQTLQELAPRYVLACTPPRSIVRVAR